MAPLRHGAPAFPAVRAVRLAGAAAMAAAALAGAAPAQAAPGDLRAGVGQADIQPATGYYLGGWTRADRVARGQHTRLQARAIVLQRGDRKVALASIDLFMIPAGMVQHIGEALADRGLSEQSILVSASHTHSGPGGYANFPTLNTAAPSMQTATDPVSFYRLLQPESADPQLYRFLVERIALAIRRADDDRGPAMAGWGSSAIYGLTRNRSIEAHLANHGIIKEHGEGSEGEDPEGGYEHTIDPAVDVLRIDKVRRRRGRLVRIPVGGWSTFADHGTVTKSSFQFYNADHHASAMRVFEARVRKLGRVPRDQEVVNAYGNSNEGDMSAGLDRHGPAASDYVGRVEASAMLRAWRSAGKSLTRNPALDLRWTKICFCGQTTSAGHPVDDGGVVGLPFLTGSEEERGPLYDQTGEHYEGRRSESDDGAQGRKVQVAPTGVPRVVPILAIRVGPRLVVSVPGEGTKEMGARLRAAVTSAVAGSEIAQVVVSGLANEFVLYFTTPEEYDRQHYEGGNTHFGQYSSVHLTDEIAGLAGRLARGERAPDPADFDSTNGIRPDGPEYPGGATAGSLVAEPASRYERLERAEIAWQGGPRGLDRPLDAAFVITERLDRGRWVRAADDLGLAMLWTVDDSGLHTAKWEIPIDARRGVHRFVVEARGYRLESRPFTVGRSTALAIEQQRAAPGRLAVTLRYPEAVRDVDLTSRPESAAGGRVRYRVAGGDAIVRRRRDELFPVRAPAGQRVTIPPRAASDRYGNVAGDGFTLR